LLPGVNVHAVDELMGRKAGELLAKAGTSDPIDATVVLIAASGDQILTGDPKDISRLATKSGRRVSVIPC
jgi:hypothetical protein